jgi:hypothetical protein
MTSPLPIAVQEVYKSFFASLAQLLISMATPIPRTHLEVAEQGGLRGREECGSQLPVVPTSSEDIASVTDSAGGLQGLLREPGSTHHVHARGDDDPPRIGHRYPQN